MPASFSQEGISEATRIPRKHIPRNLKSLLDKERLTAEQAHVKGAPQRRMIYRLTEVGDQEAREIRQEILATKLRLVSEEGTRDTTLGEAVRSLTRNHPAAGKQTLLFFVHSSQEEEGRTILEERVVVAGLSGDKPQVKHLSGKPLTQHFFGRTTETQEVLKLFKQHRMVVVHGITGIGKSALAAHLADRFQGHVLWHAFHEWDALQNFIQPMAGFLEAIGRGKAGLKEGRSVNETLSLIREGLNHSGALIILDDTQKVGDELRSLLEGLVTSLERLEEVNFLVLSRKVPGYYSRREVAVKRTVIEYPLSGLDQESSQELLAARGVLEKFFERIYELTGGHPLSLELVEAPEKDLQIANLEAYFEEEVLRRLGAAEKKVLQQASVYRYPAAPEGLLTGPDQDFELLSSLVRQSMITQTSEGKFYLHDLLRALLVSRLTTFQAREMHHQAAEYYMSDPEEGRSCLEAIFHYLQAGEVLQANRVVLDRGRELIFKGYVAELHEHQEALDHPELSPTQRAGLLTLHGEVDIEVGDWPGAKGHFTTALELYTDIEDTAGMAKVRMCLGGLALRQGKGDDAVSELEAGLKLCYDVDDQEGISHTLNMLGVLHWQKEEIDAAKGYLQQSLEMAESAAHEQGIARALTNLGIIEFQHGDLATSIQHYDRALSLSEQVKDRKTMAQIYDNLGEAYRQKGEREQAQEYFERGIELAETHGWRLILAHLYRDMSALLEGEEQTDLQQQAKDILSELGVEEG